MMKAKAVPKSAAGITAAGNSNNEQQRKQWTTTHKSRWDSDAWQPKLRVKVPKL